MKIFTVPIHGISAPKLDWHLPKLGRMCADHEKECIGIVSVIVFACSDSGFTRPDSGYISFKGYVHGDEHIWLCYLKCWLPMNHANLLELLEITFEAILP